MNKTYPLIYLFFLLSLQLSCADSKTSENEIEYSEFDKSTKSDTLKFTSGIRSILHDSRGNYWFGSHNEGVAMFNGDTLSYFTIDDGLFSNQVRAIQEDKKGVIWFGTADGVNSYDYSHPGSIKKYTSLESELGTWAKSEHDLWFNAGNKQAAYRFDGQDLHLFYYQIPA